MCYAGGGGGGDGEVEKKRPCFLLLSLIEGGSLKVGIAG